MSKKRGRRSKLTPAVTERIIEAVRAGNYMETAAAYGGIHIATLYRWLEKGEAAETGRYRDFRDALLHARAEAEARNVTVIQKAAAGHEVRKTIVRTNADGEPVEEVQTWREYDWRAAAWFLERSFPDRWGKRQAVDLTSAGEAVRFTLHIGNGGDVGEDN